MEPKPSSDPQTCKGSCLCKSVLYTVTGEPVATTLCHCRNCQKITGSAFGANSIYRSQDFHIIQGEDEIKQYKDNDTASGAILLRHFCINCGSPLFILNPKTHSNVVVTTGSLEDPINKPSLEFWTLHRRDWVEGVKGTQEWEAGRT